MPTATVTSVTKDAQGRVRVRFGKIEYEFNDVEHMKACVKANLEMSDLHYMGMALMLFRQPTLATPSTFDGATIDVDFSRINWGRVV